MTARAGRANSCWPARSRCRSLVLARGLAGVVTDLYDAFFLLPILAAAALAWGLGRRPRSLLAAVGSVLVQMAVSALAQAAQILVVRLDRPARRRLFWTPAR